MARHSQEVQAVAQSSIVTYSLAYRQGLARALAATASATGKQRASLLQRGSPPAYLLSYLCLPTMLSVMYRYIQSTCATSGEGLYEGLDWLSQNIAAKS